jgi:uncharacterized protein (UPF0335 family)
MNNPEDSRDFFKQLEDKINQIPKSDREKSERIDKTIKEIKEWLNNGGFTIHDIISMLELIKTDYIKNYRDGIELFEKLNGVE